MALDQLAPEILLEISNYVDHEDLRSLCAVSHRLMSTFQHKIYSIVQLDETSRSGNALLSLASGPRQQVVSEIRYKPQHPWPAHDRRHRPEVKLSHEAQTALQFLALFTSLEKVQFDLSHWNLSAWNESPACFNRWQFHVRHGKADVEPWRILIESSLLALSESAGSFSRLEIDSLPPTAREVYRACESETWKRLLQHLTSFEITLAGVGHMGNGGSWAFGKMTAAHQAFITLFPDMFLDKLWNVRDLRLTGKVNAVIGNDKIMEPIDWASPSLHMPHLATFELEYSQISYQLIGFLSSHVDKLEKIALRNCIAPAKQVWASLINLYLSRQPKQLFEFTTTAPPVPLRSANTDNVISGDSSQLGTLSKAKMRRFVVGTTGHDITPVEEYARDDSPELDESDVCFMRKGILLKTLRLCGTPYISGGEQTSEAIADGMHWPFDPVGFNYVPSSYSHDSS
ncbi:hypothetical protein FBEOM_14104 [Fusarium beomiforme]|uniref:F-box domain-containing protein n=1 Tax=Fusarium beomiforme TaxID=44412 RepID=A0A9P5A534_9HYPO|nr:hypothetical protein FBEOM_14104 [Fusarium beomiforme]